jgi:hypothetical protein
MAIRYSTGIDNLNLGEAGVDTGANGLRGIMKNGRIEVYSSSQPASADDAVRGTLLGYITKDGAAFTPGSPTNGLQFDAPVGRVLSKAASQVWKFVAIAAGTIGWGRFTGNAADAGASSTTLPRIDFTFGVSGGDIQIGTVTVEIGDEITINNFSLTAVNPT